MRFLGNVIWLVLAGFWLAVGYVVAGIVSCLFIVTIPFGVQAFKLAGYSLWPFGRMVVPRADASAVAGCVGNVLWIVLGGFWMAVGHVLTGALLCLTIVGIPLGVANFKLAGLALAPFGKDIVPIRDGMAVPPGAFGPPPRLR